MSSDFLLIESERIKVELSSFGARVISLKTFNRSMVSTNTVLGSVNLDYYTSRKDPYFGCTVGRVANRIANSSFMLGNTVYKLFNNENGNCLHGGANGLSYVNWQVAKHTSDEVIFQYNSKDGEEGFPGDVTFNVTYRAQEGSLLVRLMAESNINTPINLTQHMYFNLNGDPTKSIEDHIISINSNSYIDVDDSLIPTGMISTTAQTPLQRVSECKLGELLSNLEKPLDLTFVINEYAEGRLHNACTLYSPNSGIRLKVYTTQPGIHLYDGSCLDRVETGEGTLFPKNAGLAIEPQHYPDSVNQKHFPSIIFGPDRPYEQNVVYAFDCV